MRLRSRFVLGVLLVAALSCGGARRNPRAPEARFVHPEASLLAQEQDVWTLEGRLVAEADLALRAPAALRALGDAAALVRANGAEARVRGFVRAQRSAEVRAVADGLLAALDAPTRQLLAAAAAKQELAEADVFMDYLTYEGLYDLAIMRLGYKRWQSGRFAGHAEAQALADSFFAHTDAAPSGTRGIKVLALDERRIELDVFGGRVRETVERATVSDSVARGRIAEVDWASNYEQLRRVSRGEAPRASYRETMAWDGAGYRVSYAVELDEYLTWNAPNPWATMLYALSVDEVADLYAGAAAVGGLEAGAVASAADPARLSERGAIGTAERGLTATVVSARFAPTLAGLTPRRGQFVVVTVGLESTLGEPLRAPPDWFTLAAGDAEYPEFGVSRPGLGAALLALAPPGARMLALPYTPIGPERTTVILVFDVPAGVTTAALVLGAEELALKVAPRPPEPPAATLAADDTTVDVKAPAAGRLVWIARPGARVVAGDPVARLAGADALARELTAAQRKLVAYERKLAAAQAAGNAARLTAAQRKVAEKQALVASLRQRVAAATVAAPVAGTLSLVGRGGRKLAAGEVFARVGARQLVGRFVMADARSGYTPGAPCRIAARAARGTAYDCQVVAVNGVRVDVRPAANAPFAADDEIVLLPVGN